MHLLIACFFNVLRVPKGVSRSISETMGVAINCLYCMYREMGLCFGFFMGDRSCLFWLCVWNRIFWLWWRTGFTRVASRCTRPCWSICSSWWKGGRLRLSCTMWLNTPTSRWKYWILFSFFYPIHWSDLAVRFLSERLHRRDSVLKGFGSLYWYSDYWCLYCAAFIRKRNPRCFNRIVDYREGAQLIDLLAPLA